MSKISARLRNRLAVPVLFALGIAMTFAREMLLARVFGTTREIEIFRLAFAAPNMLSQSLAPAFIGAVMPLLVKAEMNGPGARAAQLRQIMRANIIGAAIVTLLCLATSVWQARLLAPGFTAQEQHYLAQQIAIGWFFFLVMSLSFGIRTAINLDGVLWPGAATSLTVAAVVAAGCLFGLTLHEPGFWTSTNLLALTIAGAGCVLALHLAAARRAIAELVRGRSAADDAMTIGLRAVMLAIFVVALCKVSNAAPRFVDRVFATEFPQGTLAALEYSYGILNVPGILLATSLIMIAYPSFVRAIESRTLNVRWRNYCGATVAVTVVAVLIAAVLFIWAPSLIALAYGGGAFDETAVATTALILKWQSAGLGPMVAVLILGQALLAYRAYGMLLAIGAMKVAVKIVAIRWLSDTYGLAGLAASFSVTEFATLLMLAIALTAVAARHSQGAAARV